MGGYDKQMKQQEKMMKELKESQQSLMEELRYQRRKQKTLVDRIKGDTDTVSKLRGNRVLMLNDGNISLPVYDYLHYQNIFDDFERQRRMETLELLNRYGESIVKNANLTC